MLRFGLVGCGTHARWAVLPAMAATKRCKLVAVADINPENLGAVKDPSIHRYTDYREMLAKEQLDAVYVATLIEVHCEPTVAALEAGCHVICEKPMAASVEQCRRMIAAAEAARKVLAIDFESRYIAANQQVRQWVAEGWIGTVRAVHIHEMWDGHKSFGPLSKRREGFLQRSGCLDCGIHKLDLARFYSCGGEWRDVQALGAWFGEKVKYPPHIAILARLSPGILVTVNASLAYTAYIKERHSTHGCIIVGDKGVITDDHDQAGRKVFRLVGESLSATCPLAEEGHGMVIPRLLEELDMVVSEGKPMSPSMATGYDGLMAQIAMDAANSEALRRGDVAAMES